MLLFPAAVNIRLEMNLQIGPEMALGTAFPETGLIGGDDVVLQSIRGAVDGDVTDPPRVNCASPVERPGNETISNSAGRGEAGRGGAERVGGCDVTRALPSPGQQQTNRFRKS